MFNQTCVVYTTLSQVCVLNNNPSFSCCPHVSLHSNLKSFPRFPYLRVAISAKSDLASDDEASSSKGSRKEGVDGMFPIKSPRKAKRGRKSEKVAVEDFVRGSLEKTFASIRGENSEVIEKMESVMKERVEKRLDSDNNGDDDDSSDDEEEGVREKEMVVEENSSDWPIDADVGWGIRASEYFEQHSIKNVVGEDGAEIDWEGEIDDSWLKEINCLEWESFAFHPSPLIVLVFERYKRAKDNWMVLKELEKAAQVYWGAKDRLPPRMVKLDINIEKDLAYALKVKSGPQVLFLRGTKILYREKEVRTADELVRMIAHFYYKAKRPSWVDETAVSGPY